MFPDEKAFGRIPYARLLGYVIFLYFLVFTGLDLIRLWGFGYSMEDIGIFRQVIWNTLNGNWFQTSMKYPFEENVHWLGFHFSILTIVLCLPFYALFPYAETLVVIHVSVVAATAFLVYRTLLLLEIDARQSFIWSVVYLLNPITLYHAMFSLQEITFATPMIILGIIFTLKKNFPALVILCLVFLITKEHYGLTVSGFGLMWWYMHRSAKQGLSLTIAGLAGFVVVIFYIVPHFSPYDAHYMLADDSDSSNYGRYQWLKQPLPEVLSVLPEKIFGYNNIVLIVGLLLLFCFLPLGGLFFCLPLAADLITIILSGFAHQKSITYYYSAPFIPVLAIASAYTLKKITRKSSILAKVLRNGVLLIMIIFIPLTMKLPVKKLSLLTDEGMDWAISERFLDLVDTVPADKMLYVDQNTGAYITGRRKIARMEFFDMYKADYVLLRISPYMYAPVNTIENQLPLEAALRLAGMVNWGLVYWEYPYAMFRRGAEHTADVKAMREEIAYYIRQRHMAIKFTR